MQRVPFSLQWQPIPFLIIIFLIIVILTSVRSFAPCGFHLHFPDDQLSTKDAEHKVVKHLFMSAGHIYVFFGKISIQILCPFLKSDFSDVEVFESFVYFTYQHLVRYVICKYHIPFSSLCFNFFDSFFYCENYFQFDVVKYLLIFAFVSCA